jgi:hypothetical protein
MIFIIKLSKAKIVVLNLLIIILKLIREFKQFYKSSNYIIQIKC